MNALHHQFVAAGRIEIWGRTEPFGWCEWRIRWRARKRGRPRSERTRAGTVRWIAARRFSTDLWIRAAALVLHTCCLRRAHGLLPSRRLDAAGRCFTQRHVRHCCSVVRVIVYAKKKRNQKHTVKKTKERNSISIVHQDEPIQCGRGRFGGNEGNAFVALSHGRLVFLSIPSFVSRQGRRIQTGFRALDTSRTRTTLFLTLWLRISPSNDDAPSL